MQLWNQGCSETQNVLLVSFSPKLKASWEGKYKKSFFLLRSMRARPYRSCLSLHSYYIEQRQVHIRCSVSCMTSNSTWLALFIPFNIKTASLLGLLLLLLSRFSRVRLCATPQTAAHQAPVPGILQARTLEWVATFFSNAGKWKVQVKSLSRVRLFTTPWTAAHQAPPSMGFSRQEHWSGVPWPSPPWVGQIIPKGRC